MKLLKKLMSFTMVLLMLVSMLPVSVAADEVTGPVCAQMEGCTEAAHNTECPLYVAPPAPCSVTGCEKTAGHEGECTVDCTATAGCTLKHGHADGCVIPQTHTPGCNKGETHEGDCFVPCTATEGCILASGHGDSCRTTIDTPQTLNSEGGEDDNGDQDGGNTVTCNETANCPASTHTDDCVYPDVQEELNDMLATMASYLDDGITAETKALFDQSMGILDLYIEEYEIILNTDQQAIYDRLNGDLDDDAFGVDPQTDTDVAAIGSTGYESLQAAVNAAVSGDAITLLKDTTETQVRIANGKNVSINFAGFTLNGNVFVEKGGTADLSGGTITETTSVSGIEVQGVATLTNMNITSLRHAVRIDGLNSEGTKVTINSGTYQTVGNTDTVHAVNAGEGSTTLIKGGTFIGAGQANNGGKGNCVMVKADTTVTIEGGTYYGANGVEGVISAAEGLTIKGGNFASWNYDNYVVQGKAAKANANSTYDVVNAVAEIGTKGYATLQAAVTAATNEQTVKLLADVTENVTVSAPKDLTLNLNGKVLSGGTTAGVAALTNLGTVTITGSGTIKREDNQTGGYYVIENNGTMIIENGTFANNAGSSSTWSGSSLVVNGNGSAATLTINDGDFTQGPFIAVKNDDNGTLTINGGAYSVKAAPSGHTSSAVQNWNSATIKGGTFSGAVWTATYDGGKSAVTNITGGTFEKGMIISKYQDNEAAPDPTVSVTGGTHKAAIDLRCVGHTITKSASVSLAVPENHHWEENAETKVSTLTKTEGFIGDKPSGSPDDIVADAAKNNQGVLQIIPSATAENTVSAGMVDAIKANHNDDDATSVSLSIPVAGGTAHFNTAATSNIVSSGAETLTLKIEKNSAAPESAPAGTVAYDITLVNQDDDPVPFAANDGKVTITLPLPANMTHVFVTYYESGERTNQIFTAVSSGSSFAFTTGHFSTYVVESANAVLGNTGYATLEDAIQAANADDTVKCLDDAVLTADLVIEKGITLDLGGKKITGSGCVKVTSGEVAISNGTITAKTASSPEANIKVTGSNVTLTLTNLIVSGADYGLRIEDTASGCVVNANSGTDITSDYAAVVIRKDNTLNVNGAKLKGYYFGISGNGSANHGGTTINVTSGEVKGTNPADSVGIFHPQSGTLNISGGTISGLTGVEMRAGTLNVTGGSISGTTGLASVVVTPNGNGNTTQGAGIAVTQHTAKSPITVNVEGGSVTGTASVHISDPEDNDSNNVDVNLKGGTFTGPLDIKADAYGSEAQKVVSGGTYSHKVNAANSDDDYAPIQNANGSYGVGQKPEEGTITDAKISKILTINWDDNSNEMKIRPSSLTVHLYADGKFSTSFVAPSNEGNTWTCIVTKLPAYKAAATAGDPPIQIVYTVKIDALPNYATTYSADTFTITNKAAISYVITQGAAQKIVTGSAATFTSNAAFSKLVRVLVDGVEVNPANYTAVSGSTKITLSAAFIKTLTLGEHTLTIQSTDGSASTTFTVKEPTPYVYNPDKLQQTGQLNWPLPVAGILGITTLAIGLWFLWEMKKERYES